MCISEGTTGKGAPVLAEMLWGATDALVSLVRVSEAQALTVPTVAFSPFLAGLEAVGFLG